MHINHILAPSGPPLRQVGPYRPIVGVDAIVFLHKTRYCDSALSGLRFSIDFRHSHVQIQCKKYVKGGAFHISFWVIWVYCGCKGCLLMALGPNICQ